MSRESTAGRIGLWGAWISFVVASVASGFIFWAALGTIEAGNRLFRRGNVEAAAKVYRARLIDDERTLTASYNLGTALLSLESDEAERHLIVGTEGTDALVAQRSYYNLGYRLIRSAEGSTDPVSAGMPLIGAIQSYRAALRLNPGDPDTRWNLAVAQRRFDELVPIAEEGPVEDPLGGDDVDEEDRDGPGVQPEAGAAEDADGLPPAERGDQDGSEAAAREALMGSGDPGPLSEAAARELLLDLDDRPERVIRSIFWSWRPGVPRGGGAVR